MICDLLRSYLQRDERTPAADTGAVARAGPASRREPAARPPEPQHLGPRVRDAERGL